MEDISGTRQEGVGAGMRLQNEQLHDLYSRYIILMTKSLMMSGEVMCVARMWEKLCVRCFGRKN